MNVSPLYDRVLIERQEEPTKSESGLLFLPDSAKEKPARGTVLAVGAGKVTDNGKLTPLQVEVGQTVVFGKYSGTEIKFDGVERLIMREDDILGIIE
jgi:chaperonin GroES